MADNQEPETENSHLWEKLLIYSILPCHGSTDFLFRIQSHGHKKSSRKAGGYYSDKNKSSGIGEMAHR